ncbi:hypothetical protein BaRGS_00017767, partial [Batillaria attramentaria]
KKEEALVWSVATTPHTARVNARPVYIRGLKRKTIDQGRYAFKRIWAKLSGRTIITEGGTVLLDNYTNCYSGYGPGAAPVHRFTLPRQPGTHKIVDALLSRPRPTHVTDGESLGPKMLAITSNNKLLIVDLHSGRCLQEVLVLGSRVTRLKNINWLEHEEAVFVSTTLCHSQRDNARAERNAANSGAVKIMAVFNVWPLEFVCMFEVNKEVCGSDVTDAMMSQGMLITMHQSRHVRMYDLNDLLPQVQPIKLFDPVPSSGGHFGQSPTPLPFNLVISELPRCLFEVRCDEHNIQIGGNPWHYLISPARNGRLDMGRDTIELDRAVFHADESGRIIHIGAEEVKMFSLKPDASGDGSVLSPAFTITLQHTPMRRTLPPVTTASGRSVKRRMSVDEISGADMCLTIHEVDYEDELDVLMICTTVHQPDALHGTVGLYDNLTGRHLTSVTLDEPWPDYSEHNVHMDADTIVQVVKATNGKFVCQMYRLYELCDEDEQETSSRQQKIAKPQRPQSRSSQRGRRRQR